MNVMNDQARLGVIAAIFGQLENRDILTLDIRTDYYEMPSIRSVNYQRSGRVEMTIVLQDRPENRKKDFDDSKRC